MELHLICELKLLHYRFKYYIIQDKYLVQGYYFIHSQDLNYLSENKGDLPSKNEKPLLQNPLLSLCLLYLF